MVDTDKISEIRKYIADVKSANNEEAKKQRFISLLNRLYDSESAKKVIDQFAVGAEKTVLNIKRENKASERGRADTQYQQVIIEFEKDLKKTGNHAKEQLAEYLSGNWNSGDNYNFTLISSDCIEWRVYAPDVVNIKDKKNLTAEDTTLIEKEVFILSESKAEEFYYFIDTYLFKSEKQKATLRNIQLDFGQTSNTFITCFEELDKYFQTVKDSGEVKVAFEEWKRFLSIGYDKFEASEKIFLIHTYLSIFAKMLAYEIVTHDDHIDDDEIKGIITGSIFEKWHIKNFTDNDFFHWVGSDIAIKKLIRAFRAISSQLDCYDFNNVEEDILKGVYQELIDRDTRQSLGEYYTPDWLCESVVNELDINATSKILDPSCGSGSFLRIAIDKIKTKYPHLTADKIAENVHGIDIHPLSVLISKTTLLVALGEKIKSTPKPILLNVYLADTLLTPVGSVNIDLYGEESDILVDGKKYGISTNVFSNPTKFDAAINAAEEMAELTKGKETLNVKDFQKVLERNIKDIESAVNSYHSIYKALKEAKEQGRDSIWKFIILNLYKPCFFGRYFDFVIGNPPWFTYGAIKNSAYQNQLRDLATKHNVMPAKVADFPHLEIAAIFLAHCTNFFLKDTGKLAFVLPRSFFSASHHDNTRGGKAIGVRITGIWDLEGVSPLFNVPSCVLFSERAKANINKELPKYGRDGKVFEARLPKHNITLKIIKDKLRITDKKFYYAKLGKSTAYSNSKMEKSDTFNAYKKLFKQGATLVPRNFYFIDVAQEIEGELKDRVIAVETSKDTNKDAKKPWKGITTQGRIHTDFLFKTALAQNILPFALHNPKLVLMPIEICKDKTIKMLSSTQIMKKGYIETAQYFQEVERLWDLQKTEKNKVVTSFDWLNYQNKLTTQKYESPIMVLYNASAKDANATVVERSTISKNFIVDYTAYVFYTNIADEAYYLTCFLNSSYSNVMMKDFQSKGLFGARHVSKKILDVPFPEFNKNNPLHLQLAELGKKCSEKAALFVENECSGDKLSPHELGKIRLKIKEHLKTEIKSIDSLIKSIVKS